MSHGAVPVRVATAVECEAMRRRVVAAIVDGEPLEDLLRTAAGLDAVDSGPVLGRRLQQVESAWRRLGPRIGVGRATPPGELARLRRACGPFATHLAGLPVALLVDHVGVVDVVAAPTVSAMAGWLDRVEHARELVGVHDEVRRALADLTGARMRLDLGCRRMER